MHRREFLLKGLVAAAVTAVPLRAFAHSARGSTKPEITVYRSPTCRCCIAWADHLRENGFVVDVKDTVDMNGIKAGLGIPAELQSCHTGVVGKYAIEGHVPAADILRLLKKKPKIAGLAVPGMPAGSPGMEIGRVDKYDVIAFAPGRKSSVFASH